MDLPSLFMAHFHMVVSASVHVVCFMLLLSEAYAVCRGLHTSIQYLAEDEIVCTQH